MVRDEPEEEEGVADEPVEVLDEEIEAKFPSFSEMDEEERRQLREMAKQNKKTAMRQLSGKRLAAHSFFKKMDLTEEERQQVSSRLQSAQSVEDVEAVRSELGAKLLLSRYERGLPIKASVNEGRIATPRSVVDMKQERERVTPSRKTGDHSEEEEKIRQIIFNRDSLAQRLQGVEGLGLKNSDNSYTQKRQEVLDMLSGLQSVKASGRDVLDEIIKSQNFALRADKHPFVISSEHGTYLAMPEEHFMIN